LLNLQLQNQNQPMMAAQLTQHYARQQFAQAQAQAQNKPLAQVTAALMQSQQQQTQQVIAKAAAAAAIVAQQQQAQALKAGQASQNLKAAEAAAAAKRNKKRKAPEGRAIDKVAHVIPESMAFLKLQEYERKIDDLIQHKRSDIKEAVLMPDHVKKRLRLYIYNTHAHQKQGSAGSSSDPPSWALYINGRVLDADAPSATSALAAGLAALGADPAVLAQPGMSSVLGLLPSILPGQQAAGGPATPGSATGKHPLSYYLKRLEVRLDPQQYPGSSGIITWDKVNHVGPHKEQFEIRRKGSAPVEASISIHMDWQPERFCLDQRLSEVLGIQYETKARILQAFWTYVKKHQLQDHKQPQQLNLPMELAQVFGTTCIRLNQVGDKLAPLLTKIPPLVFKHTIKVDGPSTSAPAVYDIEFELPASQPSDKICEAVERISKDQELEALDQRLSTVINRINEHKRRRAFYLGFSQAPVDFIHALVASQARDLRIAKSASGRDFEVERRSDLFRQSWAQEAVLKYLQKRIGAGH